MFDVKHSYKKEFEQSLFYRHTIDYNKIETRWEADGQYLVRWATNLDEWMDCTGIMNLFGKWNSAFSLIPNWYNSIDESVRPVTADEVQEMKSLDNLVSIVISVVHEFMPKGMVVLRAVPC